MMRQLLKPFTVLGLPLSRRAILGKLARIGILASAARALPVAAAKDDADLRALAALVREFVPHPSLEEEVYLDAARTIRGAMTVSAQQVDAALRRLREHRDGKLPDSDQFLFQVRTAAVEAMYRDPRVFELIGYGGNAVAKGGYLGSFNNIDWLPGQGK
jgi:hypothetical protein